MNTLLYLPVHVAAIAVFFLLSYKVYRLMAGKHAVWLTIVTAVFPVIQPFAFLIFGFEQRFPRQWSEADAGKEQGQKVSVAEGEGEQAEVFP